MSRCGPFYCEGNEVGCATEAMLISTCSRFPQMLGDPLRVPAQVDDSPNNDFLRSTRVENTVGKDATQAAVVIAINNGMYSCCDPQRLDIGAQATDKVVSESGKLRFVEKKALIQIVKGILGDPDHPRPSADLTSSQSKMAASPRATRARRSSSRFLTSSGTGIASKWSCKSCQSVSMMMNFCPTGMALTSAAVTEVNYHMKKRAQARLRSENQPKKRRSTRIKAATFGSSQWGQILTFDTPSKCMPALNPRSPRMRRSKW